MKRISAFAVATALMVAPAFANAADMDALKAEAVGIVKGFGGALKGKLGAGMKAGGPVNAIGVCNTEAPGVADAAAQSSGWSVGRTSLKLRNPNNEPDAWELATLKEFDARRAGGESPDTIAKAEIVEENGKQTFRFMKAIGTGDVCLNCHGADVKPEVAAKLDGLYPDDQARGYHKGEIRGAFTLKKDL